MSDIGLMQVDRRPPATPKISVGSGATDVDELGPLRQHGDFSGLHISWFSGVPLSPSPSLRRDLSLAAKRAFDIVGALVGLVVLSPFFVLLAIAIVAVDRGPVLFRQQREGRDGVAFEMLKFRSLRVDRCDPTGIRQVAINDTRVTSIGAFMRRTCLDELPQLVNVLAGHMSLIGPRPHVPGMVVSGTVYADLVPHYGFRHAMRPGLTGWAQCNGLRGPTFNQRKAVSRIGHDIAYVQNFSLLLDLKILVLTVACLRS